MSHDPYSRGVLSHDVPSEHHRLTLQENVIDPHTFLVLERLPIRPDWRCLELGAGAGSVARWLSARCPRGTITAADIDTRYLDPDWAANLRVRTFDLTRQEFPAASFDLIHARMLLLHLPEREQVLARAARWLAPGGAIVIEDPGIFPADSSPHPVWRKVMRAIEDLMARSHNSDQRWARQRLPRIFAELGLTDLGLSIAMINVGDRGPADQYWRATFEQLGPDFIANGSLSPQELAEAQNTIDDPAFVDTPFAMISGWARRPAR